MKLEHLFEQSRGAQLTFFLDYLETRCPLSAQKKEVLKKFASVLFKDGWTYSGGPSNTDFMRGSLQEGRHRVVLPEKHRARDKRSAVSYQYARIGNGPTSIFRDLDIMVSTPEDMLSALHDAVTESNAST